MGARKKTGRLPWVMMSLEASMTDRRTWWTIPALALLVMGAGALAATVDLSAEVEASAADPCFRYGRLECCLVEE